MAVDHMRSWQVGDVTVTAIVELWDFRDHINMTIEDAAPHEVIALPWLHPHYATPAGEQRMNFQAFVVRTPDRIIMVDTCIGNGRERGFDVFSNLQTSFLEDLAAIGIGRGDVDLVLCTHLHHDHVGWNTMWEDGRWVPTFPNARYLFGQTEKDGWERFRADGDHDIRHLVDSIDPIVAAGLADFVEADVAVCPEIRLAPSHGHTPGHMHVCIASRGAQAVITGDLMHHPIQCAMPHRIARFDLDKQAGRDTRIGFVERYSDSDVLIIGSHFAEPSAGFIRGTGADRRFVGLGTEGAA